MTSPITRRTFITGSTLTALTALAACSRGSSTPIATDPTTSPSSTLAPTATTPSTGTGAAMPAQPALRVLMPPGSINLAAMQAFEGAVGMPVEPQVYADPAFVADRLVKQQGDFNYDVVVAPTIFVPGAIEAGLLLPLDPALIPSTANLVDGVRGRAWDPDDEYTVCKEIGYTGYAWDRTVFPDGIDSWEAFLAAAEGDAADRVTLLREGIELLSIVPWSNGEQFDESLDPDAVADELASRLADHVLDLDSFPSARMLEGGAVLAQMWSGEGRALVNSDPERWGYAVGGPLTGAWMQSYMVPAAAPNPELGFRFIETMLDPQISADHALELGTFTGVRSVIDAVADAPRSDLLVVGDEGIDAEASFGEQFVDVDPEILRQMVLIVGPSGETPEDLAPEDSTDESAPTTEAPQSTEASQSTEAPETPATTAAPVVTVPDTIADGRQVLRPQDQGDDVVALQQRLSELGFNLGRADGDYGDVTMAAVLAFQRSQGLQTDGVIGAYTWAALDDPKPVVTTSRGTSTRGVPEGSPSDASTASESAPAPSGGSGRWTKAIIYLDSFKDEFFDENGNLAATFQNSPGVNGLTPTGTFHVYSRSADTYYSKNPSETMKWMVRFNGGVGFHNIPRIDGVPEDTPIGTAPSSHGCIRHRDEDAKRIYDHLVDGATVIVQHG